MNLHLIPRFRLKHKTLSIAAACALLASAPQAVGAKSLSAEAVQTTDSQQRRIHADHQRPRIQMAILLDTSGSMGGLIDQTRNQLWNMVNEFSTAKRGGLTPILEVALFEYGNSGLSHQSGYIRKLNSFTRELDRVSEGLFALKTNGGSEYCGMVIDTAVKNLQWSQSGNDIKVIFIAGNEPFTQGPVNYHHAIKAASKRGISVNTIFAGDFNVGVQTGWQTGAALADGDYMSIDADRQIVHIDAPQDREIAELNQKLNQTYVPYGKKGQESAARQIEQDKQNSAISRGLLAKRAKSKASSYYHNSNWDLVDAVEEGKLSKSDLADMKKDELPATMQDMTVEERVVYVEDQAAARKAIKQKITQLSEDRDEYVAGKKQEQGEQSASMNDALSKAVRKQATRKGYKLGG